MKITDVSTVRQTQAYALLMVMILTGASMLMMTGALNWGSQNAVNTERFKQLTETEYVAEAATEKVLAQMTLDFQTANAGLVFTNMPAYQTNIPNSAEFSGWTNYQFSDAMGNAGRIYVARTVASYGTNSSALQSQYSGLNGFCDTYRILANVKRTGGTSYNITNAIQQDIQLALIPVFQFAIFYNTDMEFAQTATITVNGRAHSNGNIITGSSANETFNGDVTSVGYDMTVANYMGLTTSGGTLTFNGQQDTNVASLSLPIGTNNTSAAIQQVLQIPPTNETIASAMGQQRYFNKAEMLVLVTDSGVTVGVKNDYGATSNNIPWSQVTNGWTNGAWITTNKTLTDQRESKTVQITEIDVAKFTTWVATNSTVTSTLGSGIPPNILYVSDSRAPSSTKMSGVRLVNGATLPSRGLTVATPNPVYTLGNFNTANPGTANTANTQPASIVCDAYTLLSGNWSDAQSSANYTNRSPTTTTVNAAVIAGNVLSTGSTTTGYSGGVNNLPRLLENWTGQSYWLTGSLVCLYQSAVATNKFQMPGAYYSAPTRNLSFDTNFLNVTKIPPGCPLVKALIRGQWSSAPPGVTNYTRTTSF